MAEMSGLHFLRAGNIYFALPLTSGVRISLYSQNSPRPNCSFALSRNTYFVLEGKENKMVKIVAKEEFQMGTYVSPTHP
jgi:hypothetical protein